MNSGFKFAPWRGPQTSFQRKHQAPGLQPMPDPGPPIQWPDVSGPQAPIPEIPRGGGRVNPDSGAVRNMLGGLNPIIGQSRRKSAYDSPNISSRGGFGRQSHPFNPPPAPPSGGWESIVGPPGSSGGGYTGVPADQDLYPPGFGSMPMFGRQSHPFNPPPAPPSGGWESIVGPPGGGYSGGPIVQEASLPGFGSMPMFGNPLSFLFQRQSLDQLLQSIMPFLGGLMR